MMMKADFLLLILLILVVLSVIFTTSEASVNDDNIFSVGDYNSTGFTNLTVYEPSIFVEAFHHCPHIGKYGIVSEPKFFNVPDREILESRHATIDEADQDAADAYLNSLLAFPILLGCVGLLALVCLDLGIDGYFDWLVPKLGPKSHTDDQTGDEEEEENYEDMCRSDIAIITHQNEVSRKNWLSYFSIAIIISVLGTNFVFFGNARFNVGYDEFKKQIGEIADDLFEISTGVTTLFADLNRCSGLVDTAVASTCPQAADVQPKIVDLEAQLYAFASQVNTIGDYVVDVNDSIHTKVSQKDAVLYTFYSLSMAMLIVFGVIAALEQPKQEYMKYTLWAAHFAIVVLTAQGTFEFMLMMYFSDFCMDPMTSVYESMNGLGIIQQTAKHYGFCKGLNPIHRNLANSYSVRDTVGHDLVDLFDYTANPDCECRSDRTIIDSYRALQDMHTIYENLATLMDCPTVHYKWMQIYELSLCHYTLTGLLALWINGWFQVIGLLLVAISASVLMLYFDKHWFEVEANRAIVERKNMQSGKLNGNYDQLETDDGSHDVTSDSGSDMDSNVRV